MSQDIDYNDVYDSLFNTVAEQCYVESVLKDNLRDRMIISNDSVFFGDIFDEVEAIMDFMVDNYYFSISAANVPHDTKVDLFYNMASIIMDELADEHRIEWDYIEQMKEGHILDSDDAELPEEVLQDASFDLNNKM